MGARPPFHQSEHELPVRARNARHSCIKGSTPPPNTNTSDCLAQVGTPLVLYQLLTARFLMACLRILLCLLLAAVTVSQSSHVLQKRSFVQLGCMGMFDRSKFARLDAVCEECYELYREPDIHALCRSNCFKNSYFSKCIDALLLTGEQEELDDNVRQLYGRRK